MKKLLIAVAALLGLSYATVANAAGQVAAIFVCELEAAGEIGKVLIKGPMPAFDAKVGELVEAGTCALSPTGRPAVFAVERVIAGPYTDPEGDKFYLVQVQPGGYYTIAWPEFNAVGIGEEN